MSIPDEKFVSIAPESANIQDVFVSAFKAMQFDAYEINRSKGFNEIDAAIDELEYNGSVGLMPHKVQELLPSLKNAWAGLKLMLVVSELGEALEAIRKNKIHDDHIPKFTGEEAEVADAVIRLMNYASNRSLRLAEAIVAKQNYNRTREFKHGGKVF